MKQSIINDNYSIFPYQKDFSGGKTNNGGFDLSKEPWRIVEISEAANFPALYKLIEDLNKPESSFLSLGCDAGYFDGSFFGYIEFTWKDGQFANNLEFISNLDSEFYNWAGRNSLDLEKALRRTLTWEYSYFCYSDSSQRIKVCVAFQSPDQDYAGKILDVLRKYFLEYCQLP